MTRNWQLTMLRGVLAIIFAIATLIFPAITLTTLVLFFGAYVLFDGAVGIYAAITGREDHNRWWLFLLEGVIGVFAGILTFIYPGITALVLLYLIAFWAIGTGILEIMAAFELRKEISNEWLLGLSGVMSVIFGGVLVIAPGTGALAVTWIIGLYAFLFGITMLGPGWQMRDNPQLLSNMG